MSNDLNQPATKADMQLLKIELSDRIQRLDKDLTDLKGSMRWQIVVPSLTLLVSLVIHYIFK